MSEAGVPVGVPESVWKGLSPASKLAWAREHQPLPVVERRLKPVPLTSEQVAELAKLPAQQRLTVYRELQWQAQQQKG